MLKCVVIDDEPLGLELIKGYVAKFPGLELVQSFEDALSAAELLRRLQVDILFIDIQMPHITGLELVRTLETTPAVIFITAYKKFAMDGFELDAVDYLLKPIAYERFSKAVNKAIAYSLASELATVAGSVAEGYTLTHLVTVRA
jgi:two-component system LytT family response regulator